MIFIFGLPSGAAFTGRPATPGPWSNGGGDAGVLISAAKTTREEGRCEHGGYVRFGCALLGGMRWKSILSGAPLSAAFCAVRAAAFCAVGSDAGVFCNTFASMADIVPT